MPGLMVKLGVFCFSVILLVDVSLISSISGNMSVLSNLGLSKLLVRRLAPAPGSPFLSN